MRQVLRYGLMAVLLTAICAVGHAAKKSEVPVNPKLLAIQEISVLPVVDARQDKKATVDLEKLQNRAVNLLKGRNYPASASSTSGEAGQVAVGNLEGVDPLYIKKLGPASARWVMVIVLIASEPKVTYSTGATFYVELAGYLFDKDTGECLWKNRIESVAGGGTGSFFMKGMLKDQAFNGAVMDLIGLGRSADGVPIRPKPGK